jgi:bacterial/archaeal transporter family-2 protein
MGGVALPEIIRTLALAALGVAAGVSFVAQTTVNAHLRVHLQSPFRAAFVSYLGGTLAMAVVLLLFRQPFLRLGDFAQSAWWSWLGGLFGAVYVVISIVLLPRMGAATVVGLIVAGQMLASMAFDHFALLGVARHPANVPRLIGAVLLVAGVIFIRR